MLGNSLASTSAMWDAQVPVFASRRRVIRFDHPGHGGSPFQPVASVAALAGELLAALDALGVRQFDYCGVSLGGALGMELALAAPDRVTALVLANTAARFGEAGFWNQRMETAQRDGVAALAEPTVARWLTATQAQEHPARVAALQRMVASTRLDGYLQGCRIVRDFDARERLHAIRTPTLVITGEDDAATPPALGIAIADAIPGSRLRELPAAHLANVGCPDAFSSAVLGFLDGLHLH